MEKDAWKSLCAPPIPSGESPLGTGRSPVPPSGVAAATSEGGAKLDLNRLLALEQAQRNLDWDKIWQDRQQLEDAPPG